MGRSAQNKRLLFDDLKSMGRSAKVKQIFRDDLKSTGLAKPQICIDNPFLVIQFDGAERPK